MLEHVCWSLERPCCSDEVFKPCVFRIPFYQAVLWKIKILVVSTQRTIDAILEAGDFCHFKEKLDTVMEIACSNVHSQWHGSVV